MKFDLKDFQQTAVSQLVEHIRASRESVASTRHAFVLSAPTGSGKTAMITAVMERLLTGDETADGDAKATFLWVTDAPELNEQSKRKILASSGVFTPQRVETVESGFDQPLFDNGKLYFLNTQKLGQATTYTHKSDARSHTLWETISRTASDRPENFYFVLDEAHKGLGRKSAAQAGEEATIVSRLIVGSADLTPAAMLIGISATPKRFNDLLDAATDRVRWPTHVGPEEVRESGLIKDQIILWHTRKNGKSDWALLREAAERLADYEKQWRRFCDDSGRDRVKPILVVQVSDGSGRKVSNTDLGQCLAEIETVLGDLPKGSVGHCFQEPGVVELRSGRRLPKIQPSDIQEDEDIRVVLFKMALNTGWDCPRAEVMMSFRRAVDQTLIAQLVGRMVRTPLAERILTNPALNSVGLYLPNWDDEAVESVIRYLTTSDDAIPVSIERADQLTTYGRAARSDPLFKAAAQLPTYPSKRANKASNVRRLLQLARYLANDEIDPDALDTARSTVLDELERNRRRLKGQMKKLVAAMQRADLIETRLVIGIAPSADPVVPGTGRTPTTGSIQLVDRNVRDLFDDAGRRLGAGLHVDYLNRRTSQTRAPSVQIARAELCALVNDKSTSESLERLAGRTVRDWWGRHHAARLALPRERQAEYARVNRMAATPEAENLDLSDELTMRRGSNAWKRHIYSDQKGDFYPSPPLNKWEQLTLEAEMASKRFRGWYRNPVRKEWSLGVPYDEKGLAGVMYPDFLIFRSSEGGGIIVDLLEPHAPSQGDTTPKLLGLCRFAEDHGDKFGRIAVILVEGTKGKEKLLPIDVNDPDIRAKAKLLTENPQVVALARELNKRR